MASPSHQRWLAHAYRALHRGNRGDVEFYRDACREGTSILELGVGSGRVLLDVVGSARDAVGVDRDPALLALAEAERAKRNLEQVQLVCADMASFDFERRFDRVLIPYSGFWCLPPQKKRQCLRAVRRHLSPGGLLLLDVYDASDLACSKDEVIEEPDYDDWDFLVELQIEQHRYGVFERNVWWPSRQRLRVQYQMQLRDEKVTGAVRRHALLELDHYYLFPEQLRELLHRSGFRAHPIPKGMPLPDGQRASCWTAEPTS